MSLFLVCPVLLQNYLNLLFSSYLIKYCTLSICTGSEKSTPCVSRLFLSVYSSNSAKSFTCIPQWRARKFPGLKKIEIDAGDTFPVWFLNYFLRVSGHVLFLSKWTGKYFPFMFLPKFFVVLLARAGYFLYASRALIVPNWPVTSLGWRKRRLIIPPRNWSYKTIPSFSETVNRWKFQIKKLS